MRHKVAASILAMAVLAGGVLSAAPAFANDPGYVTTTKCSIVYSGNYGLNGNDFSTAYTTRPSAGCGGGIAVQILQDGRSTYLGITHGGNSDNTETQVADEYFGEGSANHWYLYQNANRSANQF